MIEDLRIQMISKEEKPASFCCIGLNEQRKEAVYQEAQSQPETTLDLSGKSKSCGQDNSH